MFIWRLSHWIYIFFKLIVWKIESHTIFSVRKITIVLFQNYAETLLVDRGGGQDEREHCITLPPTTYQALSKRRMDISSRVSAHIIWDNDNNSIMLLG